MNYDTFHMDGIFWKNVKNLRGYLEIIIISIFLLIFV